MSQGKKITVNEMIGKGAFTSDNIKIGRITKIIDQPDSEIDDKSCLGDIRTDFYQIVVELSPEHFTSLVEPTEILFSSQTISEIFDDGFKLLLTKASIDSYISQAH